MPQVRNAKRAPVIPGARPSHPGPVTGSDDVQGHEAEVAVALDQQQHGLPAGVPRSVDPARVEVTTQRVLRELAETGAQPFGAVDFASLDPHLDPKEAQRQYARSLLNSGNWVSNETETGAVLLDQQGIPAAHPNGERVEVSYEDLDLATQGFNEDFDYMGIQ